MNVIIKDNALGGFGDWDIQCPIKMGPYLFNWKVFQDRVRKPYEGFARDARRSFATQSTGRPNHKNQELNIKASDDVIALLKEDIMYLQNPRIGETIAWQHLEGNWKFMKEVCNLLCPHNAAKGYEKPPPAPILWAYYAVVEWLLRYHPNRNRRNDAGVWEQIENDEAWPDGYEYKKTTVLKYHDSIKRIVNCFLDDSQIDDLLKVSLKQVSL